MTFKSIDLQMSVPRTQDAGTMHGQQLHKQIAEQQLLADEAAKRTEKQRQMNSNVEEPSGQTIRDSEERRSRHSRRHGGGGKKEEEREQEAPPANLHPYKGRHIDITY